MSKMLLSAVTYQVNGLAVVGLLIGGLGLILSFLLLSFYATWVRARRAGVAIPFLHLIAMQLRKVPLKLIVDACVTAAEGGITCDPAQLEAQFLAGGNITAFVEALILAKESGLELTWAKACAIDLATKGTGQSLLKIVRHAVSTNEEVDEAYKTLVGNKI